VPRGTQGARVDPGELVDTNILKELDASGFIKTLYEK
jgi:hypothetical protein